MLRLRWSGRPPPEALRRRLAGAGVELADDAPVTVVSAADWRSQPAPGGPWLWLPPRAPSTSDIRDSVLAGAYAVVSADAPDATERMAIRLAELALQPAPLPASVDLVAESPQSRALLAQLAQAARTSMPVLLTGETGTGKEVAARLVHAWSERPGRFVPINCAAIPNELMEGELFGYARGAFSGAVHGHEGLVSAASGGTVFLDEIDDTPHALQVKLLRVLEDRVVTRLGETAQRTVDFRLIAATNRDLRPLIEAGTFGADLYERLAIVSIELPPLRERRGDIPGLVRHFIERFYREEPAAAERGRIRDVSPEAMELLREHRWPGNVRELRNVVFGALVAKVGGTELLLSDLPRRLLGGRNVSAQTVVNAEALQRRVRSGELELRAERETLERMALEHALDASGGNAARAAALLGAVGRGTARDPGSTVRAMMRRLGVRKPTRAGQSRRR